MLPSTLVKNGHLAAPKTPLGISYHLSNKTLQGCHLHHLRLLEIEIERQGLLF